MPHASVDAVLQNQDILCRFVFLFLDVLDLCRLSSTCKAWREAAQAPQFWSELSLTHHPMTTDQV